MSRPHTYSVDTRDRIIDSAIDIITKKGYSKTTLEDIVKNIGLTRGAFYWYFKDKKEILDEIVLRYTQFYETIDTVEILDSAYDTLRNMIIKNIKSKIDRDNDLAYIVRYNVEAISELQVLLDKQTLLDDKLIDTLSEQIKKGTEQGEFRQDINIENTAMFILFGLLGFDTYTMLHKSPYYQDERVNNINIYSFADNLLQCVTKQ